MMLVREVNAPRVILAAPDFETVFALGEALRAQGFAPVCVRRGARVLAAFAPVLPERPAAAVVDVAISDIIVPTVVEHLRQDLNLDRLPIALLAAIHNKDRYRRAARQLFGADVAFEPAEAPVELPRWLDEELGGAAGSAGGTAEPLDEWGSAILARRVLSDVALFNASPGLIPDGVPMPLGIDDERCAKARRYVERLAGPTAVATFDDEAARLRARLVGHLSGPPSLPGTGER